jgi:hypothetical protein
LSNSTFLNRFKSLSYSLYGTPIRVELYERKMTLKELIELLAKYGFVYDYYLLKVSLDGKATNNFNLHYFSHIYRVLNIKLDSSTFYSSALRWEEIKQFKKERRNINRIKRGLDPV